MLKYLLDFDIDSSVDKIEIIEDLDITDKTILQEQINKVRKSYKELLDLFDSLKNDRIKTNESLLDKRRSVYLEYVGRTERADVLNTDEEILELQSKISAIDDAMNTVKGYIDFLKSDLRILGNSQYSKF